MSRTAAIRRDWGTLFFDGDSGRVRLWYLRGRIYTANELAEANIHPVRACQLGEYGPRSYDAEKVARTAAELAAVEKKRGLETAEAARIADNVRWIRATGNAARFRLSPEQSAALLAGHPVELGDLFGTILAGAGTEKAGS